MDDYQNFTINFLSIIIFKIICITVGYYIIKMGYNLINDGAKGNFTFSAEYTGFKGGLVSSSPGLLFLVLGTVLIIYTVKIEKSVDLDSKFSEKSDRLDNSTYSQYKSILKTDTTITDSLK